jgi:hypothetical protein
MSTTEEEEQPAPPPAAPLLVVTQVHLQQMEPLEMRLKALLLASYGLIQPGGLSNQPFFDPKLSPWCNLYKEHLTLERKDFMTEIDRRWDNGLIQGARELRNLQNPRPRPKQWSLARLQVYLDKNPIDLPDEVAYIISTVTTETENANRVLHLRGVATEEEEEGDKEGQPAGTGSSSKKTAAKKTSGFNWTGQLPWLRLVHCLVDDEEIKKAYTRRFDIPSSRIYLDNRKSVDKRPRTVWELLADKWNNEDFTCSTIRMLGPARDDFRYPIVIDHAVVKKYTEATPKMCKDKMAVLCKEVRTAHQNWSKSGEGEGAHGGEDNDKDNNSNVEGEEEEEPFDTTNSLPEMIDNSLTEVPERFLSIPSLDLSDKGAYVKPNQGYVLYAWYMFEQHQLLESSMQRLDSSVATGQAKAATAVPDVMFRKGGTESSIGGVTDTNASVATFVLADSVVGMAAAARYAAELEATDRKQTRSEDALRHAEDLASRRRDQDVTIYTQIDVLHTEKRNIQREVVQLKGQLLDYCESDKESTRMTMQIALLESQIEDVHRQILKKEQLILQQHSIFNPNPRSNTPEPHEEFTGDDDEDGVDCLTPIQKDLMSTSEFKNNKNKEKKRTTSGLQNTTRTSPRLKKNKNTKEH